MCNRRNNPKWYMIAVIIGWTLFAIGLIGGAFLAYFYYNSPTVAIVCVVLAIVFFVNACIALFNLRNKG